jgi:hypothetical protein
MHVYDNPQYPPTIVYGSKMPDLRLRSRGGRQIYFCRKNRNLHLTDKDFDAQGTYQAGRLLRTFCEDYCAPEREGSEPCPAFVRSHKVFTKDNSLASVALHSPLQLGLCLGAQKLLEMTETPEEHFLLSAYLDGHVTDELAWRNELVETWNKHCARIDDDWTPRVMKFDQMMWATIRYPALIPQAWLNWLAATDDKHIKALEENPSRVDFVAFYHGESHIVEVDGPSHYAAFDEVARTYSIDERAYARNLKIVRSMERDGWCLTRVGRIEVRDAMPSEEIRGASDDVDFSNIIERSRLLRVLPFPNRHDYPAHLAFEDVGLPELQAAVAEEKAAAARFGASDFAAGDDIPF